MDMEVPKVKLGSQGLIVSKQGLGCMGMSSRGYGPLKPEAEMVDVLRKAIESGITFLDTSDAYGPWTNEILIGKAIKDIREKVQIATKFGITFPDGKQNFSGGLQLNVRGDPDYVRSACEGSLKRLQVDYIDLYYQHRVDPTVPIEITVGAMKQLVEEGKVKYLGLSEASAADIRRAHAVHPITAVQIEWSLWTRDIEEEIAPTCRELGIGIVPYSPLGRGFFSGKAKLPMGTFERAFQGFKERTWSATRTYTRSCASWQPERSARRGSLRWLGSSTKATTSFPFQAPRSSKTCMRTEVLWPLLSPRKTLLRLKALFPVIRSRGRGYTTVS